MKRFLLLSISLILLSLMPFSGSAGAQDNRSLRWDRFDVTIDNIVTSANRFDVAESYELVIETGPFSYGFAEIPMDRLDTIDNVAVYQDGRELTENCMSGSGSFCVTFVDNNFNVQYYFLSPVQSGDRVDIRIEYTVHGALRSYEDGDQLYWVAVPEDLSFPVVDSKVTVIMPENLPPEVTASYPDTWREVIEENTVIWTAPGRMNPGDSVEVRVQYPHDPQMEKPSWQAGYDRERYYIENIRPFVSLGLLCFTGLTIIGGLMMIYIRYAKHGRDPQAVVAPEYLTEPPSDELPGIVGVLLDERADMKDIMATLVDLARRGYVVIEQTETGGVLGMFSSTEFVFHRTEKDASRLTSYERSLLNGIFPMGRATTEMSDLKNKFYSHISGIKSGMYQELVKRGYFTRSPETTRTIWFVGGGILLAVGIGLAFAAGGLTIISPFVFCPPVGLAVIGIGALAAATSMPARTPKGAQETAKWHAFRQYLRNVEKYTNLAEGTEQFDRYIAYAVAFGIEQEWIRQFAPVLRSMPTWYFPTYVGGPWHGGYVGRSMRHGGGTSMGDFTLGGPGGLNEMSRSLTEGLNAMSTGMTQMLNDASNVMTSRPQSSGSGGGFSGGGGGGGGGSGGGSRGFG